MAKSSAAAARRMGMAEDGEMVPGRRVVTSPAPAADPAPPLEDEDLLSESLLRLPPRPSSLPRASLVCKLWRRLLADHRFLRRFRAHHGAPPLLGFFSSDARGVEFTPALGPPDRLPAARFSLRLRDPSAALLGCRHGRVLAVSWSQPYFLVWDPLAGDRRRVAILPALDNLRHLTGGAVVCAAAGGGRAHARGGGCQACPFHLVMVATSWEGASACVYSSETGEWGDLITMPWPDPLQNEIIQPFFSVDCPSTLVGNCICWLLIGTRAAILQFDLDTQSLAVVEAPEGAYDIHALVHGQCQFLITPAGGGGLGFLVLSGFNARLWKRTADSDGIAGWVLVNDIEVANLLSLRPGVDTGPPKVVGFAEEENAVFLWTAVGVFMVYLDSLQFTKLSESMGCRLHHPYKSFYAAGVLKEFCAGC
ncbi:hypothetical protein ACP4OV_003833 [Aristida adscensionis]